MYSTCLFCQRDLGRNETFPTFPVGRRLAYDAERGRLWVVCQSCARWNLSPLEERWEAIEEAERRFRETRLRVGTGEISLARLREGTELVRIGRPARLELAAWRYGDQFGRRRRQHLMIAAGVAAGGALAFAGALTAGIGVLTAWQLVNAIYLTTREGVPWATVSRLRAPDGKVLRVRPGDLRRTQIGAADDGRLEVTILRGKRTGFPRGPTPIVYTGAEAERVLGQLLPSVNRMGGTEDEVRHALGRLEDAGSPDRFFASLARRGARLTRIDERDVWRRQFAGLPWEREDTGSGLFALPPTLSLAIEMAAHEERERRALEGELAALAAAWREAEEIARVADELLLPGGVEERFRRLKGEGSLPEGDGDAGS